MNLMESYRHAQDGIDGMLATVPPDRWDAPTPCPGWTVRDIAGHVTWGQEQMRHWAIGQEYADRTGAPGAPRPAGMAGTDPLAAWQDARQRADPTLTDSALVRMIPLPGGGELPLRALVTAYVTDLLTHTWDIGHACDLDVTLDAGLVAESFAWARERILRVPGFFGPELTPPAGADEQTRWLAFLGRAAWQPVAA